MSEEWQQKTKVTQEYKHGLLQPWAEMGDTENNTQGAKIGVLKQCCFTSPYHLE
jgi:hypothetical protein